MRTTRPPRRPGRVAALAAAAGLTVLPADAGRLSRDLAALELVAGAEGEVDVIILYRRSPGPDHAARLREGGGSALRELRLVRGTAATVPVGRLRRIAEDPDVVGVSWDEAVAAATDIAVPALGAAAAREVLGADGTGIVVAVIDSGVAPGPGLGAAPENPLGRIAAWVDLVEPNRRSPSDPYGHGTHVAGIIAAAEGGGSRLYGGVAPGAQIASIRVLDHEGRGRTSDVIAALQWAVDHAAELGIRVVNLSLGHPVREPAGTDPLVLACDAAWDAGLLVVASAGNLGREPDSLGTVSSPGNAAKLLTVGALADRDTARRSDDTVATYSSRGPTRFDGTVKPDLLAPGDSIVSLRAPHSLLDRSFPDNRVGSSSPGAADAGWFRLSGTSMAAAMVSGAAAVLLAAEPQLDPDTLKARLMRSAEKRDEAIWARGAGALDLLAALDDRGRADGSPSPRAAAEGAGIRLDDIRTWGSGGWDPVAIYGPEALWDLDAAWERLQAPEPDDEAPLVWQVPAPEDRGRGIRWERVPGPSPDSVIWQLRADSVIWQRDLGPESVIWQGLLQSESVIWQRGVTLTAESVIWQRGLDILVLGDLGIRP
jgi:serine protease AprX